jgi:hypothetical protein
MAKGGEQAATEETLKTYAIKKICISYILINKSLF